jgi:HlyD family secretion protein
LDVPLGGVVTKIATSARRVPGKNSLVFPVEVEISQQDEVVLRPGMSTRAEILNRTEASYALVPIEAIQEGDVEDDEGYTVFVAENGIARQVKVTLGPQDDRYQAITSGLKQGDRVVTGPYRILRSLQDGDSIAMDSEDDDVSTD